MQPNPPDPRIPADLLARWWDFSATPSDATAQALAEGLKSSKGDKADAAVVAIAEDLARRSARDRCAMTALLTYWLIDATGFLHATAAAKLDHKITEAPRPAKTAEHLDPAKATAKPKAAAASATEGPAGSDLLDALDLAVTGQTTADLDQLRSNLQDAEDASAFRHFTDAMHDLRVIVDRGSYSKARRAELAPAVRGTSQEQLVEQVGFRAAPTGRTKPVASAKKVVGALDAVHENTMPYWRTDFRGSLEKLLARVPGAAPLSGNQVLVNSPTVLRKLRVVLPESAFTGVSAVTLPGTSLTVLSGVNIERTDGQPGIDDQLLEKFGASPSAFQLYAAIGADKPEPDHDLKLDTHVLLARLITSSRFSRLQEIAAGSSGMARAYAMLADLVLGLADGRGPLRQDPLTANALGSLGRLLAILLESVQTPAIALRAMDLMVDEICLIAAVSKRYYWTTYQEVVQAIMLERAPCLKGRDGVVITPHLLSSGMDAIGTALATSMEIRSRHGAGPSGFVRSSTDIDYFETDQLLDKLKSGQTVQVRSDVLVAALNPSTPFVAPDAGKLAATVLAMLEKRGKDDPPFALIVDTTVELGKDGPAAGKVDTLVKGLLAAIESGQLELFLCKSYQKYASLGFGRIAAGDLTLLSQKGSSAYARYELMQEESTLGLDRHDEAQLLVHLLKHGHQHELALIQDASGNAEFVDSFCWPAHGDQVLGSPYVPGIPLLLRSNHPHNINYALTKFTALDYRSSFSFLRTSYVDNITLPKGVGGASVTFARFNTGHESKAAMVEYFYALGHLATGALPGKAADPSAVVDLAALTFGTIEQHLAALPAPDPKSTTDLTRYRNNVVASYCLCATLLVREPKAGRTRLLLSFFEEHTTGVTIDTQQLLATTLLGLIGTEFSAKGLTEDGSRYLDAVSRAVQVLASWQVPTTTPKLKLAGFPTSAAAQRLEALIKQLSAKPK